jgi:hypothetical protein
MESETTLNPTLEKLQEYKEGGFVFHGSSNHDIQEMEPRQTKETDPRRTFNIDTAVFADIGYVSPIIFGVVDKNKIRESIRDFSWSTHWDSKGMPTAKIPLKAKEIIENAKGVVYILPGDSFVDRQGFQVKSMVAVTPQDSIEVTLQDYYDAGGKIEWTE